MRISTRLFLYVFGIIVVLGIALGYVSVRDERAHQLSEIRSKALLFARTVTAVLKYYHPIDAAVDMETILDEVAGEEPAEVPYLRIYAPDGSPLVLSCSACQTPPPIPHPSVSLEDLPPGGRERTVIEGREEYLQVLLPVLDTEGRFQGAVEVVLSLRPVAAAQAATIRRFLLFGSAGVAVLGVVLLLIARWGIAAPLRQLQQAARSLGGGDLSLRLERSGVADIDDLIAEFNRMARGIEEQNRRREQSHLRRIDLERGLRHADKLASIGQLTSGLAHELGTPLNVIGGRAEQLLARLPPDAPSRKPLETVIRQTEHITGIIDRLLSFSREGSGAFTEIELEPLMREAFSLCRLRAKKASREVELEVVVGDFAGTVPGAADALRQLFVNLMLNSFQAMEGQGSIRVDITAEESDTVRIVYEDTGPGIRLEHRDRVFDPFFTTKDVGEGTGLGLYLVSNIVEEHRGGIRVEEAAGGGARFIVTFPRSPAGGPPPEADSSPDAGEVS